MAKYFKFLSSIFLLTLISCQEGGDAGDLWGQWRMSDSNNEFAKYVSFSGPVSLFKTITRGEPSGKEVYGNFQHVGDSLFIQCCSIKELRSDTVMVEEQFGFRPFTDIRVRIVTLNEDVLVLSKEDQIWSFYKY